MTADDRAALATLLRDVADVLEHTEVAIEREAIVAVAGVYEPYRDYWHVEFDLFPVVMRSGYPVLVAAEDERLKVIFDAYHRARLSAITRARP